MYFQFTTINQENVEGLREWYEHLLVQLRPNAVGLVDAFDLKDEVRSILTWNISQFFERVRDLVDPIYS